MAFSYNNTEITQFISLKKKNIQETHANTVGSI